MSGRASHAYIVRTVQQQRLITSPKSQTATRLCQQQEVEKWTGWSHNRIGIIAAISKETAAMRIHNVPSRESKKEKIVGTLVEPRGINISHPGRDTDYYEGR
jgi:hypothetical protein